MSEKHLTPNELAVRWDIHKSTVLRLYRAGVLPGIALCLGKARTTVRFRLAAVEAFERKREGKTHG
jgi:excisionase family DNA binding protein